MEFKRVVLTWGILFAVVCLGSAEVLTNEPCTTGRDGKTGI